MFKRLLDRFRKAPPAPWPLPDWVKDSPVDWQGGDIAVSREAGLWISADTRVPMPGPAKGSMCRVLFVLLVEGRQFLRLKGWDGRTYNAAAFDKLDRSSTSVEDMIARHKSRPRTPERVDA